MVDETIPYSDIKEIMFERNFRGECYINLAIGEGRKIEVGRVTGNYTPKDAVSLGFRISRDSSGPFNKPSGVDQPTLNQLLSNQPDGYCKNWGTPF